MRIKTNTAAVDYNGWVVVPQDVVELTGEVAYLPVVRLNRPEVCDFCSEAAEYRVNASQLGSAGHDTFHCQDDLTRHVNGQHHTGDKWFAPVSYVG